MPNYLVELEDGRKLQVEADSQPTEQEVLAALGDSAPAEKQRPFIDITDTASALGEFARGIPTTTKSSYYQIKEGLDNPWKRSENYLAAGKATQEYQKELDAAEAAAVESGDTSSVSSAFRAAAPSSGFSIGTMASSLAGGSLLGTVGGRVGAAMGGPAGLAAGEIGGRVVGAFGSAYGAAYRAAGAQFLDDARDEIARVETMADAAIIAAAPGLLAALCDENDAMGQERGLAVGQRQAALANLAERDAQLSRQNAGLVQMARDRDAALAENRALRAEVERRTEETEVRAALALGASVDAPGVVAVQKEFDRLWRVEMDAKMWRTVVEVIESDSGVWQRRVVDAEAQAAAMREALMVWRDTLGRRECQFGFEADRNHNAKALASDAGRALLDRLIAAEADRDTLRAELAKVTAVASREISEVEALKVERDVADRECDRLRAQVDADRQELTRMAEKVARLEMRKAERCPRCAGEGSFGVSLMPCQKCGGSGAVIVEGGE